MKVNSFRSAIRHPRHARYVLNDLGRGQSEDGEHVLNQRKARRSITNVANVANITSIVGKPFVCIVEVVVEAKPSVSVKVTCAGAVPFEGLDGKRSGVERG